MNITDALGTAVLAAVVAAAFTFCAGPARADEEPAYITLTAAYCEYPSHKVWAGKVQDCRVHTYRLEDNQDMAYCELIRDAITADQRANISARCDFID